MNLHQVLEKIGSLLFSVLLSLLITSLDFDRSGWHQDLELSISSNTYVLKKSKEPSCPNGYFRLRGMSDCHPVLDCDDIQNDVRVYDDIVLSQTSLSRVARLAKWGKKLITHNVQNLAGNIQAFDNDLKWLKSLNPSDHHVQLVGFCDYDEAGKVFLTEYHRHGSALKLNEILIRNGSISRSETASRLRFCVSFAELLDSLHRGRIVLTGDETDDAEILLSRMVIGDSPWRLVLNSFDDLRFLTSENDTFDGATFIEDDDDDEDDVAGDDVELLAKTTDRHKDIFVAPRVCNVFLRGHDDKFVKNQLLYIHRRCRDRVPARRPSASTLLTSYKDLLRKLELQAVEKYR